jgi:hypothetical protein
MKQACMHLYSTSSSEERHTTSTRKVLPTFELNKDWGKRFSEVKNVLDLTRILNGTRTVEDRLDAPIKAAILGRAALVLRDFELNPSVLREIEIDIRKLLEKEREKISSKHPLIFTLTDSVRRLLDTHRHFKTSPSLEILDSACSYMSDVWRIMIRSKNNHVTSTVLRYVSLQQIININLLLCCPHPLENHEAHSDDDSKEGGACMSCSLGNGGEAAGDPGW